MSRKASHCRARQTLILTVFATFVFISDAASTAQSGAGGAGLGTTKPTISVSVSTPIQIAVGVPVIASYEPGVFLWAASGQKWYLSWQGAGELVWIRIAGASELTVVDRQCDDSSIDSVSAHVLEIHSVAREARCYVTFTGSTDLDVMGTWQHEQLGPDIRVAASKRTYQFEVLAIQLRSSDDEQD